MGRISGLCKEAVVCGSLRRGSQDQVAVLQLLSAKRPIGEYFTYIRRFPYTYRRPPNFSFDA